MPDDVIDPNRLSPWLLRIVLDRAMLLDKKLSVADVAERVNNEFEDELSCIFNDDNARATSAAGQPSRAARHVM